MRDEVHRVIQRSRLLVLLGGAAALAGGSAAIGLAGGGAAVAASPGTGLPVARGGLDVLPFPGTPDAAPGTPIDFPALAPSAVKAVTAVGSSTGLHAGRLTAQPGGRGSQFAPDRPFAPGERVSVTAALASPAAGTASGAPASRTLRFSFTIERPASESSYGAGAEAAAQNSGMVPAAASSSKPTTHSFVSQPRLHPPVVEMIGKDTDAASGDIFVDAQNSGHNGPYILNKDGDLLWYHPTSATGAGPAAFDDRVQTYNHRPVLTYFQGRLIPPAYIGNGVGVMLNERYQRIHRITAGAGYQRDGIDEHELTVTRQGTALVTVYAPVRANLRSVGGPTNGTVLDSIVQEINIKTNRVVWEWNALRHVPVSSSYARYHSGTPFDYFHINSIQPISGGSVIVSGRNTWGVYSINKKTGRVNWELGGKHPSFRMGSGTNFEWQHHAQLHRNNVLTVFDDASAGPGTPGESQSRALKIKLGPGRATLVHAYLHSPAVLAGSQGSVQVLFNGNVFVGWGAAPTFSEYTPGGTQIFKAWFRSPVQSYRAYRSNSWTGRPQSPPALVAKSTSTSGRDTLYASWNGATRVARWRVLGGRTAGSTSTRVATVPWKSFEANIPVSTAVNHYFKVQALDSKGTVLGHGTSAVVKAP